MKNLYRCSYFTVVNFFEQAILKRKKGPSINQFIQITPPIFSSVEHLIIGVFHPSCEENSCELFSPTNLRKTIEKEGKNLGFETVIIPSLTHSTHVEIIDDHPPGPMNADGIITTKKRVGIAITHADCQATFIVDTRLKTFGLIHAGWRGLFGGIYQNAIAKFIDKGSNPVDLALFIGPSLGVEASFFDHYLKEIPPKYHHLIQKNNTFDLKKIALSQFIEAGIDPKKIEISSICTFDDTRFFSYRRSKRAGHNLQERNFSLIGFIH